MPMIKIPETLRHELSELAAQSDTEIDFSDIPETTEQTWVNAERGRFYKPHRQKLTVSLDDDVMKWLKSQGGDYRLRVNEVLRNAMLRDTRPSL